MKRSVFAKFVLPFFQWYVLMILAAIAIDFILHQNKLVSLGLYFGYAGTGLIVLSFIYSLRKRKMIQSGSPKKLLIIHEYFSWIGSVFILVHAGIHFNAILPWLAIMMLLINVASGLVGKFLLKKANETLKDKMTLMINAGASQADADKKLFWDAVTVDLMKKWRVVHIPISLLFGILALLHIVTIIIFY
jgi:hypothetical protein